MLSLTAHHFLQEHSTQSLFRVPPQAALSKKRQRGLDVRDQRVIVNAAECFLLPICAACKQTLEDSREEAQLRVFSACPRKLALLDAGLGADLVELIVPLIDVALEQLLISLLPQVLLV